MVQQYLQHKKLELLDLLVLIIQLETIMQHLELILVKLQLEMIFGFLVILINPMEN